MFPQTLDKCLLKEKGRKKNHACLFSSDTTHPSGSIPPINLAQYCLGSALGHTHGSATVRRLVPSRAVDSEALVVRWTSLLSDSRNSFNFSLQAAICIASGALCCEASWAASLVSTLNSDLMQIGFYETYSVPNESKRLNGYIFVSSSSSPIDEILV